MFMIYKFITNWVQLSNPKKKKKTFFYLSKE